MSAPGTMPGGYPGGYPPISYIPGSGGIPWYHVGYPRFPGNAPIPVVLNPSPGAPSPGPSPGPTPTIPVGHPGPQVPGENSLDFWSPWPLPPLRSTSSAALSRPARVESRLNHSGRARLTGQNSEQLGRFVLASQSGGREFDFFGDGDGGTTADSPGGSGGEHVLKYHGGRTIRDLYYVNLYVSGDTKWSRTDVEQIDSRLLAAMRDEKLNNVLLQYFENQAIRSTALPSHPLVGYTPKTVTRGDIQLILGWLHHQGFLESFDLANTVFNLLLPPGTLLNVDDQESFSVKDEVLNAMPGASIGAVPVFEEGDSTQGLAGYHGSVVTEDNERVYYAVSVYSQRGANNTANGIPVFREPWKNVVATLYHQLVESRTNPDVEEAMRHASNDNARQYLGWVSESGLEIGDGPIRSDLPLTSVFREVSLTNGSGVVPIQLPWSNAANGPEGPISQPHPLP